MCLRSNILLLLKGSWEENKAIETKKCIIKHRLMFADFVLSV